MITKEELNKMSFVADDWEPFEQHEKTAHRPIREKMPDSDDVKNIRLKQLMAEYFFEKFDKDYNKMEARCMINIDTFKSLLNGRRRIKRRVLVKFCIGMEATLEEANEMMTLQGHPIDEKNYRMDYILSEALKDGIDIQEYYDWGEEYNFDPDVWK